MPELNIIGAKEKNRYFPYQGALRVTRKSFWTAGQDSYTLPPAQNPDLFQLMTNVEPINRGVIQRRRGYQQYSNQVPSIPYREGFSFRSESLNLKNMIWTSTANVLALSETTGLNYLSPVFTPSLSANFAPRMVLSRNYGYFADGVQADSVKWDGTTIAGNLTNWGIDIKGNPASTNGPNAPGTAADVANGGSSPVWANPNNIKVQDGNFAAVNLTAGQTTSDYLQGTNFGFAVTPAASVITGVKVDIKGKQTDVTAGDQVAIAVMKDATHWSAYRLVQFSTVNGFLTLGGSNDTWGLSLTGTDVNSVPFGVVIVVSNISGQACTYSMDFVTITAYVSGSAIVLGAPAGTGITLLSGRIYTIVFQNTKTGHTSGLYPFSASTGPLTNQGQPLSGLPVSSDPQVDQKLLLATADGGDETTLYLVAQILNATTTYTDTMPDSVLLTQPIYQQTNQDGSLHGVANNNIPPLFNFPTKHKGRIYGSIQSTLYFSKNLDDVTTSTGTITSKWEEAYPATNQMDVSETAETIQGIMSDGETLWIATERCIRRLIGDSPSNFQKPEIQFNEAGVLNMDSWKIVYSEGQPIGTMWITPDFRVMESDFNTFKDVGTPIQDVLNTISVANVSKIHASFVQKGTSEYYMLYIPSASTEPNTVCVYNLRSKRWCVWVPIDTITASLFFIDGTGAPRWMFAANAGSIYEWKDTIVPQDRVTNTPVSYDVTLKTSWLDFGDEGLTKAFNKIIATTSDPLLTVTVQGAITDTDLDTGGVLVLPATPLQQDIFGDLFVPMVAQDGRYKWYQLTFTSPASLVTDVLDGFDFEILPSMRM